MADDDDGHAWETLLCVASWVDGFAGSFEEGELGVDDGVVLTFRDAVAVDDDVLRVLVFVVPGPELDARAEEVVEVGDHSCRAGWMRISAGHCARLASMEATMPATLGAELVEPGGGVTLMPTSMVSPSAKKPQV